MNIVISDTTALIIFAKTDTLLLLSNLFKEVYIPKAVYDELNMKDDIVSYRIKKFNQIILKPVSDMHILKRIQKLNIDRGEVEAIALAIELDLQLVIDERKGRKVATGQGLSIVGSLGILIENYKRQHITLEETHLYFSLFKKHGLHISEALEKIWLKTLDGL